MKTTIAAIATPPGIGGVGVIRISGIQAYEIACALSHRSILKPRFAHYTHFYNQQHQIIDSGLLIFFPGPASYTGEDVCEIQGHGNPHLLDMLIERILELGATPAEAGEFTRRAYMNEKLDLVQAEAVADLINSQTRLAAIAAQRSLQGKFSEKIDELLKSIIGIRVHIEAGMDFSDEDIDFVGEQWVGDAIRTIQDKLLKILEGAHQGQRLRDGIHIVLTGKPNAGKSTLLNALSGRRSAIVSEEAGTTRDLIREQIEINGIPLTIVDTAGIRESHHAIELEGQYLAKQAYTKADHILLITTANQPEEVEDILPDLPDNIPITIIFNKIDIVEGMTPEIGQYQKYATIRLSAQKGWGMNLLLERIAGKGNAHDAIPGLFSARRRHIHALTLILGHVRAARMNWERGRADLIAEDLRQAQQTMNIITGRFTSDDLLGEIFSELCIGK